MTARALILLALTLSACQPGKTIARGRYVPAYTTEPYFYHPECWTMKRIEGVDTVSFCATESEWKSWPSPVTPKETK